MAKLITCVTCQDSYQEGSHCKTCKSMEDFGSAGTPLDIRSNTDMGIITCKVCLTPYPGQKECPTCLHKRLMSMLPPTPEDVTGDLMKACSVRYCLGRKSYIVSECAGWIITNWNQWSPTLQKYIRDDVEREFKRHEDGDGRISGMSPLGMECDIQEWKKVRALWHKG